MIRLTPLEETRSGQELIKNERVAMLTTQIRDKFKLPDNLMTTVRTDLEKLNADTLSRQILYVDTANELEHWFVDHLSVKLV